jgi:hypothetical protein
MSLDTGDMPLSHAFEQISSRSEVIKRLKEHFHSSGKLSGHILLAGPDVAGMRLLALASAEQHARAVKEVSARNVTSSGALMEVLASLNENDFLLITNLELLQSGENELLQALAERQVDIPVRSRFFTSVRIPLKGFTCFATASSAQECPVSLLASFSLRLAVQTLAETSTDAPADASLMTPTAGPIREKSALGRDKGLADSELCAVGIGLKRLVDLLVDPVQEMIGRSNVLGPDGVPLTLDMTFAQYLHLDCIRLIAALASAEGCLSDNKVKLYVSMMGYVHFGDTFPADKIGAAVVELRNHIASMQKEETVTGRIPYPTFIQLIEHYDTLCGTPYSAEARQLWLRLARAAAQSDGKPSLTVASLLRRLERELSSAQHPAPESVDQPLEKCLVWGGPLG